VPLVKSEGANLNCLKGVKRNEKQHGERGEERTRKNLSTER